MSGVAGSDITGDMSLTLAKLRRENALSDVVHDPEEDAPHVVGIPRQYALPTSEQTPPVSYTHLDVYKRQPAGRRAGRDRGWARR